MTVTILGKRWRLLFVSRPPVQDGEQLDGCCDPLEARNRAIRVYAKLTEKDTLETIIHECLHAAGPWAHEDWVEEAGRDVARVLWKLGYRKADA